MDTDRTLILNLVAHTCPSPAKRTGVRTLDTFLGLHLLQVAQDEMLRLVVPYPCVYDYFFEVNAQVVVCTNSLYILSCWYFIPTADGWRILQLT